MSTKNYYTIYETINNINGKIYRGKHKTKDQCDYYLGSGVALKNAVKKYGKDNFTKTVLYNAFTNADMNYAEEHIFVNSQWLITAKGKTYNMTTGGNGSPDQLHSPEAREKRMNTVRNRSPERTAEIMLNMVNTRIQNGTYITGGKKVRDTKIKNNMYSTITKKSAQTVRERGESSINGYKAAEARKRNGTDKLQQENKTNTINKIVELSVPEFILYLQKLNMYDSIGRKNSRILSLIHKRGESIDDYYINSPLSIK